MKPTFRAFLLCVSLVWAGQVWANTLPDACGDDKVKFDVTTAEAEAAPSAPAEGKAQIIFIETENQRVSLAGDATIRFGMDGAWVGANNGNSYFALTVDPGVHHLCASWQSSLGSLKKNIDLTSFTAEAGQVYYFAAVVVVGRDIVTLGLTPMNEDEGKYRLTTSKLTTSKPKDVRARS
ncbi:MAG TPA: hypothetical protein VHN10_08305 [Candidatus Acidoferrales bacterium]|nr:hypothetical protein [Candidatus Acidoferrales bacterium]